MRRLALVSLAALAASGSAFAWIEWTGSINYLSATINVVCDDGNSYTCTGDGFCGSEWETIQYGSALATQCCEANGTGYSDGGGGFDFTLVGGPVRVDDKGNLEDSDATKRALAELDALYASPDVTILERRNGTTDTVAGVRVCTFDSAPTTLACCQAAHDPSYYSGHCASCLDADGGCNDTNGREGDVAWILDLPYESSGSAADE